MKPTKAEKSLKKKIGSRKVLTERNREHPFKSVKAEQRTVRLKASRNSDECRPGPSTSKIHVAEEETPPSECSSEASIEMVSDRDSDDDSKNAIAKRAGDVAVGEKSSPSTSELGVDAVLLADLSFGVQETAICVVVSHVTEITRWPKNNPRGTVFSADVVDRSGDARVVAYNDLCEKFYALLKIDQSVRIRSFSCRLANPVWKTTSSPFELLLTSKSVVEIIERIVLPRDSLLPSFAPLTTLNTETSDHFINTVGIVLELGDKKQVKRRSDGQILTLREAKLIDEALSPVTVICWCDALDVCERHEFPILELIRVRPKKSQSSPTLTCGTASEVTVNPDSPRGQALRLWWGLQNHESLVERFRLVSSVEEEQLSFGEAENKLNTLPPRSSLVFWNYAEIVFLMSDSLLYRGCSEEDCSKKVVRMDEDKWFCSKCEVTKPIFRWKLSLRMLVKDTTREVRCICFGQAAEGLLKLSAEAVSNFYEKDPIMLQRVLSAPCGEIHRMRFAYRRNPDEIATNVVVTTIEFPEETSR